MQPAALTFKSIRARPVVLKLRRPVMARIATIADWPLILIDLYTNEGIVGRSYLEPYTVKAMKYLIPMLHDLGDMLKDHRIAPIELYELARKSLHFVGYQGLSMIAVSFSERQHPRLTACAELSIFRARCPRCPWAGR